MISWLRSTTLGDLPRQVRIEFASAFYHVMARGDRREDIYLDDPDSEKYVATLATDCKKTGWRIHAYALMSNHDHLVVETPEPNLVKGMTWLQGTHASRFNARHQLRGHVFGGRYKVIFVEREEGDYFRRFIDCVHLNPVRAKIVRRSIPPLHHRALPRVGGGANSPIPQIGTLDYGLPLPSQSSFNDRQRNLPS